VKDGLAIIPQPSWRNASLAGFQSALAAAITLPLVHVSAFSHLTGFAALGCLVALFGRYAPERRRGRILLSCGIVQTLAVFAMSMAGVLGAPLSAKLLLLAFSCGVFYVVAVKGQFGPPGPLIFIFAAGAAVQDAGSFQMVLERTLATGLAAMLAWGICAATECFRNHPGPDHNVPAPPTPTTHQLTFTAAHSVLAALIAVFASHAFGAEFPFWAAMGAIAVLQGPHLHINMIRAFQRMGGTIVGALIVWLILDLNPSFWAILGTLLLLQYGTEIIIGRNYGLGQMLVTPMALLMTHLASPSSSAGAMVTERILDTMLGASIGMVVAVAGSSLAERHVLARHTARRRRAS